MPVRTTVPAPELENVPVPSRLADRMAVPVALLAVYEVPVRLPLPIVSPLAAAEVTETAPTIWLVPPRSRPPPASFRAEALPSVPLPLMATVPALMEVLPV